jgi:hypothetical protein
VLWPASSWVYTALTQDAEKEILGDGPTMLARFRFRYLLLIPAIGFFIDALRHQYIWPGRYQPMNPRLIMVLGTHSREGADMWVVLLCFLIIGLLSRRDQATKEDEK